MRLLLDSNVIIAAFAARGLFHEIFEICIQHHSLITSERLLREIATKLKRKVRVPPAVVQEILKYLRSNLSIQKAVMVPREECRDPDDLEVLGLAAASNPDCIVSGDKDLLVLKEFRNIPIITPRRLYERLTGSE